MIINITWDEVDKISKSIEELDGCPATGEKHCADMPSCPYCWTRYLVNRMIRISNTKTEDKIPTVRIKPPVKKKSKKK